MVKKRKIANKLKTSDSENEIDVDKNQGTAQEIEKEEIEETPTKIGKQEKEEEKSQAKKNKGGIDMNKIPSCLLEEGFLSSAQDIPDFLLCGVCKEVYIEPELYSCGHTLCKLCIEQSKSKLTCPICKKSNSSTIPNIVLQQVLENQYPKQQASRLTELKELQALEKKLDQYPLSQRYRSLTEIFEKTVQEKFFASFDSFKESLLSSDLKFSEPEIYHYISIRKNNFPSKHSFDFIGPYILKRASIHEVLEWLEKEENKEDRKWLAVLVHASQNAISPLCQDFKKLATMCGFPTTFVQEDGKFDHVKPDWIKNLDIGEIVESRMVICTCGRHHGFDDDSSDYDSESDY